MSTGMLDRLGVQGDALYAELVSAHDGLTAQQSQALNARLILLLMNQVGDVNAIRQLLRAAQKDLPKT